MKFAKETKEFFASSRNLFLQGNLDHSEPRPNKDACLQACKDSPGCGWYSYNVETTICLEFTTCEIDSSSTDFISGQVSCEVSTTTLAPTTPTTTTLPAPDTYGNMVVVAGLPGTESEMSEVYKVSGSEVTSCGSIGKNGAFAWGVVGGYLEGDQAVMVCGGPTSKACYSLPEGQETEMSEVRHYAAAVVVENQLWISGGEEDGSAKSSIETVSFSRRGLSGTTVDLPAPLSKHCAVLLKSKNAVMIIGGSSNGQDSDKTYFFDLSSQSFSDGPTLSSARHSHMCTAFTDGGQEKVAVVGGEGKDSVEILDVATETWTAGPSLSSNLCCGVLVQAENGAILAGGFDGNSNVDSMQALNCDGGSCNWSGVSAKLGFPRSQGVGVLIPDTLANC